LPVEWIELNKNNKSWGCDLLDWNSFMNNGYIVNDENDAKKVKVCVLVTVKIKI
jgi:hypothetical protein